MPGPTALEAINTGQAAAAGLHAVGIEFIEENGGGPGVRLRMRQTTKDRGPPGEARALRKARNPPPA